MTAIIHADLDLCSMGSCEEPARDGGRTCIEHYRALFPRRREFCSVDGCADPHEARGFCNRHYLRSIKHGSPDVVLHSMADRGAREVGYFTIHDRVRRANGTARDRACVGCGLAAQQWAYDHSGRDERRSPAGLLFSLSVGAYQPMCIRCHRRLDAAHADLGVVGV